MQFDNNARMAATSTYHDLVPFFENLFKESGSDFEKFYEAAETVSLKNRPTVNRHLRFEP